MRNPSSSSSSPAKSVTTTINIETTTTKTPCCSKLGLKRGPWTPDEDELLANYIKKEGEGRWRTLPKKAGLLRCGKSCRLRWMNYLRPSVKRGQIAPDEEDLILRLHRLLGNRWSLIAGRIPGRTDNEIKNYWNTHLSKKLISQGIDPRTHKPLNPADHAAANANAKPSSSSSKANRRPSSKPDNPASNSSLEQTNSGSAHHILTNKENGCLITSNIALEHHQCQTGTTSHGYINMMDYESGMGLRRNKGLIIDEDINYCTDDVFSSFLNSLINEDPFLGQHQLQQNPTGTASISDPALPIISSSAFGIGGSWESALISSSAFSQINDPKES